MIAPLTSAVGAPVRTPVPLSDRPAGRAEDWGEIE